MLVSGSRLWKCPENIVHHNNTRDARKRSIGVARILSGVHFLPKKLTNFLVVALKDRLNIPPTVTRPAKTVLKIDSCSGWGCTSVLETGGALTHFLCKLRLKFFFTALGVQVHPLHHPGYAYGEENTARKSGTLACIEVYRRGLYMK